MSMDKAEEIAKTVVGKLDLTVRVNGEWHEIRGIERENLYRRVAAALRSYRNEGLESAAREVDNFLEGKDWQRENMAKLIRALKSGGK